MSPRETEAASYVALVVLGDMTIMYGHHNGHSNYFDLNIHENQKVCSKCFDLGNLMLQSLPSI